MAHKSNGENENNLAYSYARQTAEKIMVAWSKIKFGLSGDCDIFIVRFPDGIHQAMTPVHRIAT